MITVPIHAVRSLAVTKQRLARRPSRVTKRTLIDVIRQIGLVQIDAINVVARSQYLVAWSRIGPYPTGWLDELLHPDRKLFEYPAHTACLIPMEDLGIFAPVIRQQRRRPHRKLHRLGADPGPVLTKVLDRVRRCGVVTSKDFADPRHTRGTWWDWKPAKIALEILFEQGRLAVERRLNFQRQYALAKRVYGDVVRRSTRTRAEWTIWATWRSLGALGVATERHVADYYRQERADVRGALAELQARREVVPVEVPDWPDPGFIVAEDLGLLRRITEGFQPCRLTTLLSPFDNLIWSRRRTREVFDFEYRFEAYTPLARRQRTFGYYVMPILHQNMLVGRLDPKADRGSGTLRVASVYLEPAIRPTGELLRGLGGALTELARFHECRRITIGRTRPASLRDRLAKCLH